MRLNVFIAKSGAASRRGADELIKNGQVAVNGVLVRQPFLRLEASDRVTLAGKPLAATQLLYVLFHKPKGTTSTRRDVHARKVINDFLPPDYQGLFSCGRLDRESSGLLILTNDGNLCYQLTHPRFGVEKEYVLTLRGELRLRDMRRARQGIWDEQQHLGLKSIRILAVRGGMTRCRVIVCEGKKRHLRRLFKALGFPVEELQRIRVAHARLGIIKPGEFRLVSKEAILGNTNYHRSDTNIHE